MPIAALFEARVVLGADAGQHRQFVAAQARHPAMAVVAQADVRGADQFAPGPQVFADQVHPSDHMPAEPGPGGPGGTPLGTGLVDLPERAQVVRMTSWLITGANSGFGRHLSEQLLSRGDRVVGTFRAAGSVDDLVARGPSFRAAHLDVTDPAEITAVVADAFEALGRIDVVVSNAGYGLMGAAEELSDAQIEHQIATNLTGSIRLVRAALPYL